MIVLVSGPGRRLTGTCVCGRVGYIVADNLHAMCHRSNCRRATGSTFKPVAGIEVGKLQLARGWDDVLTRGDATAHDVRCRACGSLLYSVVREGRYAHVAMGTLRDDPTIRPSMHIFVGSKAPWFEITDNLPQHAELPDG